MPAKRRENGQGSINYDLKHSSFDRLESTITMHVIPNIGFLQLGAIKQDDIQTLLNKPVASGLSYSSIKKVYDALMTFGIMET